MKTKTTPTSLETQTKAKAEVIKLGIDIHKSKYVVVLQEGNASPKSPQRFSPESFLVWVGKLRSEGMRIVSCYEAGCFGYVLHRRLEAMGIENLVVRPRNWDEYGTRVKTDARDARELCCNLDRYLAGNKSALTPVRIPSEEEERARSFSRQRESLEKERKRLQNIGNSNARYYGVSLPTKWWKPKTFEALKGSIPSFLIELLGAHQQILTLIDKQLREATSREERKANRKLPVGLGALTASILDQEFVDYSRFSNRREVASYTGLCPGESSSGSSRKQGSINKHGNPRIRHMLIEAVWRLLHFQPDYEPIKRWRKRMSNEPFSAAKKKKMAVAIARCFAIDWWRINTGRVDASSIGLKIDYPASYAARALREGRISKVYA